ncbi:MAG: hypothetical protein OEV28_09015 [Nitrospirota bacterium]|nr:hypothetical protein [Nitrospirota bacterium]
MGAVKLTQGFLYAVLMLALAPLSSHAAAPTVVDSVEAIGSSPTQITVLSYFSGDDNRDGSIKVEYSSSSSFGSSDTHTACEKVTGGSPRVCYISKLDSSKTYHVKVTYSDPDGVSGEATQTVSASTRDSQKDIYPPTLAIIKPMDAGVVGGNSQYPVTIDFTVYDRHSGIDESSVEVVIDGASYHAAPNPDREGYHIYRWGTPTKGWHSVTAKARDKEGNLGYAPTAQFYVNSTTISEGVFAGDGKLLVRDNDNQICWDCHGGIKPHSSQYLSSKYGNWSLTCRQCHTPHNTNNIFLVKEKIKTPNSGTRPVDFRVSAGRDSSVPNAEYGYTNKVNPGYGPCETCHTKTRNPNNDSPRYRNTGSGPGDGSHKNPPFTTSPCIRCHDHKRGFSPLSTGNIACNICHPKQFDPMNGNSSTYHMYIQNAETTSLPGGLGPGNKYPSQAQPGQESEHRRCIMCHTDMDLVNDAVNKDTPGLAYNQRVSISVAPIVGDPSTQTNTDFRGDRGDGGICLSCHKSEQTKNNNKKKNDGTTKTPPWDVAKFGESAHNFTVSSQFNSDNSEFKANCAKCHNDDLEKDYQRSQYKFGLHDTKYRSLLSNINSNLTFTETSHNSTEENFCYQCHSKESEGSSNYNPNGATSDAKDAYNVEPMKQKAVKIKSMFETSTKKSFHPINGKAPYASLNGLSSAAGKHKVDEHLSLPSGVQTANWNPASSRHVECTDCHNPHAASKEPRNLVTWRPNIYHPAGSMFSGNQMVEGSFGGQVGGANLGTWGVEPSYSGAGSVPTSYTKVDNVENMYQLCFKCHSAYAYGTSSRPYIPKGKSVYGSRGGDDSDDWHASWDGRWEPGPQTDISQDFNPNNYGFHPILRRGRNQPAPHLNDNWPYFNGGSSLWERSGSDGSSYSSSYSSGSGKISYNSTTKAVTIDSGRNFPTYLMQPGWRIQLGSSNPSSSYIWYEIKTVDSDTQITLVSGPSSSMSSTSFNISAGFGWNFVPPYGPWSTITCADCHMGSNVADDPAGPHGSDNPWLLRGINYEARVDNNLDGDMDDSGDYINHGSWSKKTNICYSCHRRDIYGARVAEEGAAGEPRLPGSSHRNYSRLSEHPPKPQDDKEAGMKNAFGIWCFNCHGGDALGGIHGSNRGKGSRGSTAVAVRLRNGAAVTGNNIGSSGGSCYTKSSHDSVNTCSKGHEDQGYEATYSYTGLD